MRRASIRLSRLLGSTIALVALAGLATESGAQPRGYNPAGGATIRTPPQPLPTAPSIANPIACAATAISATSAPINGLITVTGTGLDQGCVVEFNAPAPGAAHPIAYGEGIDRPNQLVRRIPPVTLGAYVLSIHQSVGTDKTGKSVGDPTVRFTTPFTVLAPPPANLGSLSASSGYAGDTIAAATNLFDAHGQAAVFDFGSGVKKSPLTFSGARGNVTFTVPDIYAGLTPDQTAARSRVGQSIRMERGIEQSNSLPFRVKALALLNYSQSTANPGDAISIQGAFEPAEVAAFFEFLPGQVMGPQPVVTFTLPPLGRQSAVLVPDVFAGKSAADQAAIARFDGHIFLAHGNVRGNSLPFFIRPRAPASPPPSGGSGCAASHSGFFYRGQPSCQPPGDGTVPVARSTGPQCDYVCCADSPGENGGAVCGNNHHAYPADCSRYCNGGACNVQLMSGGCYQSY